MREMVHDFYGSRYASCLTQLEKLRPALKLDVHLHKFAADLSRAVSQTPLLLTKHFFDANQVKFLVPAFILGREDLALILFCHTKLLDCL